MATLKRTPRARRTGKPVYRRAWVCSAQAVPVAGAGRELILAESKAREDRARRALVLSLARMKHAHAEAVHRFEEFDEYLNAVRGRLRRAGYLVGT
jgi:hypothetical protein